MLILTLTIIFILILISMLNLVPGIHTHDVMPHPTTRPALLKCTEVYLPNLEELSLRLVAALPKACIGQTGEGSGGGMLMVVEVIIMAVVAAVVMSMCHNRASMSMPGDDLFPNIVTISTIVCICIKKTYLHNWVRIEDHILEKISVLFAYVDFVAFTNSLAHLGEILQHNL